MPSECRIERAILDLLRTRAPGKSICPSEVARRLQPSEEAWRALMPEVRAAAFRLARRQLLQVTQKGREVEEEAARGPIRLTRPSHPLDAEEHRNGHQREA